MVLRRARSLNWHNRYETIITGRANLHGEAAFVPGPPTADSLAAAPAHSALFCLFPSRNSPPSPLVSLVTAPSADSGETLAAVQHLTLSARGEETNEQQKINQEQHKVITSSPQRTEMLGELFTNWLCCLPADALTLMTFCGAPLLCCQSKRTPFGCGPFPLRISM